MFLHKERGGKDKALNKIQNLDGMIIKFNKMKTFILILEHIFFFILEPFIATNRLNSLFLFA